MTDAELRRALRRIQPPDEIGAERRAWAVVRAAFDEREPARGAPQVIRPLLVLAGALALIAAVVNPPVLNAIRDAVGRTTEKKVVTYKQALFSLPGSAAALLVNTARGPWIIRPAARAGCSAATATRRGRHGDSSSPPWGDMSSSPCSRTERCAGRSPAPAASPPRAGRPRTKARRGSRTCAATTLRIVAGDSTRGHPAGRQRLRRRRPRGSPGRASSSPTSRRPDGSACTTSATQKTLWHSLRLPKVTELAWSDDGTRLLTLTRRSLIVFGGHAGSGSGAPTSRRTPSQRHSSPAVTGSPLSCASPSRARCRCATATRRPPPPGPSSTPTAGSPRSRGRRTAAGCSPAGRAPTRSCS